MRAGSLDLAYRRPAVGIDAPLRGAWVSRVLPIVLVVAIGAALLLPRLGAQSLWLDESLTVGPAVTATGVADLLAKVRTVDTQPPASHVLLWALTGGVPRSEFVYRLPSFVAVEIGIVMLYALTRRLWGTQVAVVAALAAQLSPYLAFYAAEARNYGLWFACITTSAWVAVRWLEASWTRGAAWRWALALALVNALGLWTHLFHAFVVSAEVAILTIAIVTRRQPRRARWRTLVPLVAAQAVTAVLFAPWLVIVARAAQAGTAGVLWTRTFTPVSLSYHLFAAHVGVSFGPDLRSLHVHTLPELVAAHPIALALAAAAITVTLMTYAALVRSAVGTPAQHWELAPLVGWPVLTLTGPILYAAARDFPLHPRHLLLAWPILPVVIALGLVRFRRLRPLLVAAWVVQLVALTNLLFNPRYAKDDERGAVRFAERRSGAVTYVLGDVAPLYAEGARGRPKGFRDFAPETTDVWLVDNRTWERQNRQARARLATELDAAGFRYAGGMTRFRGIVLRHWTTRPSP